MKLKTIFSCAALLGSMTLFTSAIAHEGHEHEKPASSSVAAKALQMSDGEVKKIDKSAGKLTIKHGPLENLGMPAMTMVFKVKDPAMLASIKQGDKISFVAEKINGSLTLTRLEGSK